MPRLSKEVIVALIGAAATVGAVVLGSKLQRRSESPTSTIPRLTGTWQLRMASDVSHNTFVGKVQLTSDGSFVTGEWIDTPDNSKSGIKGTFDGHTLELERNTGVNTVQEWALTVTGDQMVGRFENIGTTPDSGTITLRR